MASEIRDINLAPSGELKIEWVKRNCDLLRMLEEEFTKTKPFAGKKIALSVHLEAKTAYLCKVLAAGGAEMYVTAGIGATWFHARIFCPPEVLLVNFC